MQVSAKCALMRKEEENMTNEKVSRRSFVKGTALAGLAAAAGSAGALYGCSPAKEGEAPLSATGASEAVPVDEKIVWTHCATNCGGSCPLQCHVIDGELAYVEPDTTGDPSFGGTQSRPCLRGRSIRRWINHPDRLTHPMKRVGKRGEGKFEQISWEEAIDTIASELKRVIDTYGNEAVYNAYASGTVTGAVINTQQKLLNLMGGCLGSYGSYSTAQITAAMPYTYGPMDSVAGSSLTEAKNSDLVVMFGFSPCDTAMSGAAWSHDFEQVREAVEASGGKIVQIDYRMNETISGHPDEWLPIRSGTDAALAAAIAYVLISENLVDQDFLDTYCVGYDEKTMPEGAPSNASYKDYIMGTGYDKVAKTPEWASPITLIPAQKIKDLAHDIANAKAPFITQGWGPQRHSNGENTARSIAMLPILVGAIGLPGTNSGTSCSMGGMPIGAFSFGENPVTTAISCFSMVEAIDHGPEMTALRDGVRGKDKLDVGIKFIWNHAGNFFNQHSDTQRTHEVLADDSKCEFIVVNDTMMTPTAKYADILLPDIFRGELPCSVSGSGHFVWDTVITFGQHVVDPKFEAMAEYDVCAAVADKLGVKEQFTEGRTFEEWNRFQYEQTLEAMPDAGLPTWEEGVEMGVFHAERPSMIALEGFRSDPEANPLGTPSGKIEIYSADLAAIADSWELEKDEIITPIPVFDPGFDSYQEISEEYPLVCAGFHYKARTHSCFGAIDVIKEVCRQQVWINPEDADTRGIKTGDTVAVKSPQGEMRIEAKVTPRIVPGVVAIPQGAWHDADMYGDQIDRGGCINTLTTHRSSPLAKGNPQHTNLVQVAKA